MALWSRRSGCDRILALLRNLDLLLNSIDVALKG